MSFCYLLSVRVSCSLSASFFICFFIFVFICQTHNLSLSLSLSLSFSLSVSLSCLKYVLSLCKLSNVCRGMRERSENRKTHHEWLMVGPKSAERSSIEGCRANGHGSETAPSPFRMRAETAPVQAWRPIDLCTRGSAEFTHRAVFLPLLFRSRVLPFSCAKA